MTTVEFNDIEISYPLLGDMIGVQQRDGSKLKPTDLVSIEQIPDDGSH